MQLREMQQRSGHVLVWRFSRVFWVLKKEELMVRNTSDDTQSEESGKEKRWWEKRWSNRKGNDMTEEAVKAKEEGQQRVRRKRATTTAGIFWCGAIGIRHHTNEARREETESGAEKNRARAGWSLGKHGVMGVSDSSRNECGFRRIAELERILYLPTNGNSRLQEMVCTRKKQQG